MSHFKEADYYDLLEVRPDAPPAEIEDAYKRQMELLSGDSLATYGLFVADDLVHFRQRVEEAHRVLSDPARRRAYDVASGFAPEALVAHEAGAAQESAPLAVSAGPPEGDAPEAPGALEAPAPVEAAPPAEAAAPEAPRVPEPGALPPFGPSAPAAPQAPPAEAPEAPAPAEDGERFDGPAMRAARERKHVTLSSISQNTRIAEYYLEYIEAERFDSLPPPIYLRSYVRQYAAAIGVDEDRAVEVYLARYNDARNGK